MNHPLTRLLSFILAAALSAAILIYPQSLTDTSGQARHGLLMVLLIGIGIGFIHGIGFSARNKMVGLLLGPILAWPVLAAGLWLIFV